ncbi:DUF3488 and transglutaminase-like domain-containing protein [Salinibacterium sp. NK8237]|uniref:DUF3488 and transglutaminase-like domain-containing protein n=1 Tax=Salinibacterium sp. NK8237 TaxID=2792038 RepID=UPI0018CF7C75|nr:DUF3488 and transglutaminase-like domain-containing protein [Salinibacterium sp. NK8237]MBH0129479.1 transglutaminase domain-containing protein [Salinibacterium sp. NK8237]
MSTTEAARATSVAKHDRRVRLWSVAGVLALAIGVAASSLGAVLTEGAWWFPFMAAVVVTLASGAAFRSVNSRAWLGSLVAAVGGLVSLVLMFAPQTAILGIIPTVGTVTRFNQLVVQGQDSMAVQRFPADAFIGIVFLICLGAVAVAVAMDVAAFVLQKPALTAIPLIVLLLVPSFVRTELHDAFVFAATALAYVAVLLVASQHKAFRSAWPLISAALVLSLIVPVVLPSVEPAEQSNAGPGLISTGVNPIINLSSDLRRGVPLRALTYASESGGEYLRVAALDVFADDTWEPSENEPTAAGAVEEFPLPPGLADEVPREEKVLQIEIERIRGKLLPVPYAATTISGLDGDWSWEPDGLTVSTDDSNSRDQNYEVAFVSPAPSIEQLEAAPTTLPDGFERYLELPETLPSVVAETADDVAGGEATRFDQALALQSFFADGDFTYSEEAPVAEDYDGSGAGVLGEFLTAKSGYCVHFASAMAAMARSLEIPARVVVGFTPGERIADDAEERRFLVSTDNLHAWPELYFPTIGWIRFEPTVSVGSAPRFAQSIEDDPSTPDVDESQPEPVATPTSTSTATAGASPEIPREDEVDTATTTSVEISSWWWLMLAVPVLVLIPALVRSSRRALRLAGVRRGETGLAWREVRDTAIDLGYPLSTTATPRQQYEYLSESLGAAEASALRSLLGQVEASAFSARPQTVRAAGVRNVVTALRSSVGWRMRVWATLAPRTAFSSRDRRG